MKKFILFLFVLNTSCSFYDFKLNEIYSNKSESSNDKISISPKENDKNQNNIQDQLNNKNNFVQDDLPDIDPKTAKNFEINDLKIPSSMQKKIKVALFLPFSGKYKELGWSIYNSSLISLFDNDINNKIELVLFDSKDSTDENKKAFKEIVNQNIKIVIGPIFTNSIIAIKKLALDNNITVISLSNNHELLDNTDDYGGVFIGGIPLETQIDKIINYSIDNGKFNYAVIAPNNQYGKIITEYAKKFIRSRGANFITSEFYENTAKDIDRVVDRVINSFEVPVADKNRDTSYLSDYDKIYPQVILIPESGKILSKITSSIFRLNKEERNFQLIGSSQWNEPNSLNDINLLGGWFAAPEEDLFKFFEKNYYEKFNKFPPRIASIAYDAVLAISKIAECKSLNQNISFADFIEFNSAKNGFEGIDGIFRFLPNGVIQRNLAVIKIGNKSFEVQEPALKKFIKY